MVAMKRKLILLLPLLVIACGGKQAVLSNTLKAMEATSSAVLTYSDAMERQILEDATSLEEGKRKLSAFRSKVDHVKKLMAMTATVLGIASATDKSEALTEGLKLAADLFVEAQNLMRGP